MEGGHIAVGRREGGREGGRGMSGCEWVNWRLDAGRKGEREGGKEEGKG